MTEQGRILGVDYGERRVGLAITDPFRIISSQYKTIRNKGRESLLNELGQIISENEISRVVIGIPYSNTAGKSPMETLIERFTEELRNHSTVPIVTWSERYSSIEARRTLHRLGEKSKDEMGEVDMMAAALMLRSYLDSKSLSDEK